MPWLHLRFDFDSTAVRLRSLSSLWRIAHQCTLTCCRSHADLLIYLRRSAYGRNECRRMVVARLNCSRMGVERRSNRSWIRGYNRPLLSSYLLLPPNTSNAVVPPAAASSLGVAVKQPGKLSSLRPVIVILLTNRTGYLAKFGCYVSQQYMGARTVQQH